jgi:hypothetical protein
LIDGKPLSESQNPLSYGISLSWQQPIARHTHLDLSAGWQHFGTARWSFFNDDQLKLSAYSWHADLMLAYDWPKITSYAGLGLAYIKQSLDTTGFFNNSSSWTFTNLADTKGIRPELTLGLRLPLSEAFSLQLSFNHVFADSLNNLRVPNSSGPSIIDSNQWRHIASYNQWLLGLSYQRD